MRRFLSAFLLVLLLAALTLKMKLFLGWSPSLLFASLIALGVVLSFNETLLLAGLTAWVMQWQPAPVLEIAMLVLGPLLAALARKALPWQSWLSIAVILTAGLGIWYGLIPEGFSAYWGWLSLDLLGSLIFALLVYGIFRHFWSVSGEPALER